MLPYKIRKIRPLFWTAVSCSVLSTWVTWKGLSFTICVTVQNCNCNQQLGCHDQDSKQQLVVDLDTVFVVVGFIFMLVRFSLFWVFVVCSGGFCFVVCWFVCCS